MKILFKLILLSFLFSCNSNNYVKIEMRLSKAKSILIDNKFIEITAKYDLAIVSGYIIWLSPENTAVLIVLYNPESDSKIYQMTIGEKGKGFKKWKKQNLHNIKQLI